MDINVSKLIEQAEENRIAYEQQMLREAAEEERRTRTKVQDEVTAFVTKWLEELKTSGDTVVRKSVTLEEAEALFTSVAIAREILYGMGLKSRTLPEKTRGILWWKRITRPALLVIFPAKQQQ